MSSLKNFLSWFEGQSIGRETAIILATFSLVGVGFLTLILPEIRDFFEAGGPVLWGILLVTTIMWTLIIERFWFFQFLLPVRRHQAISEWEAIDNKGDWFSMRIRDQIISQVSVDTKKFLLTIETMMQILPLLGLLGTVVGMIKVFDVMTFFGTGNARLMASGVSQATIPTMAGLVAAISGLYIANLLKRKADDEVSRVADQLVIE
ncbi:MAG TPA: MotA/TolQ/ExbB proton channel family protein [Gammaproteobacteria bacterium]|jgi:biopolymer transport protein ExbB|nr:MotA/TolQ/ExbB proton channel family protein [Gammaproteobacteria bacterium]|tara:strand:- start:1625 stop:2242 length:618 start_codon:yes stop_codon:yes gene_type:complete